MVVPIAPSIMAMRLSIIFCKGCLRAVVMSSWWPIQGSSNGVVELLRSSLRNHDPEGEHSKGRRGEDPHQAKAAWPGRVPRIRPHIRFTAARFDTVAPLYPL